MVLPEVIMSAFHCCAAQGAWRLSSLLRLQQHRGGWPGWVSSAAAVVNLVNSCVTTSGMCTMFACIVPVQLAHRTYFPLFDLTHVISSTLCR
jgi:hypothetical protein